MSNVRQYIQFDEHSDYVTADIGPFRAWAPARKLDFSIEGTQPKATAEELLRCKLTIVRELALEFDKLQRELAREVYEKYGDDYERAEFYKANRRF